MEGHRGRKESSIVSLLLVSSLFIACYNTVITQTKTMRWGKAMKPTQRIWFNQSFSCFYSTLNFIQLSRIGLQRRDRARHSNWGARKCQKQVDGSLEGIRVLDSEFRSKRNLPLDLLLGNIQYLPLRAPSLYDEGWDWHTPYEPLWVNSVNKEYNITLHLLSFSYTLEQSKDSISSSVCVGGGGLGRLLRAVLTPVPYKWIAMFMVTYLPLYVNPREEVLDE